MKQPLLIVGNAFLCMATTTLQAKDPVLTTPGSATWTNQTTSTGTKTVFTLTKNTVLKWDRFNLEEGSEMDFNFVGGKTVVNFLGGTEAHAINGSITSNGIVAFFSPSADLEVNGSIIAKGVTLATANADADAFSDGDSFEMQGSNRFTFLTVNGHVEATDGDVVLGGQRIIVPAEASIKASGDVLIGAGRSVTVSASGEDRIKENSGRGHVLHLGDTRASRIEVEAGQEIRNQGRIDAGQGKVFLTVGPNGNITNESTGVIVGDLFTSGAFATQGQIVTPNEGDSVPAVSSGSLSIPQLTRPDGSQLVTVTAGEVKNPEQVTLQNGGSGSVSKVTTSQRGSASLRTLAYSVPMSASSDSRRDIAAVEKSQQQVAKNESSNSLLQRSSFFGLRGGSKNTVAKR